MDSEKNTFFRRMLDMPRPTRIFGTDSSLFADPVLFVYNSGLLRITEYFKSLCKSSGKLYSQKHLANASCAIFSTSRDMPFAVEKSIRSGQMALF
jgi:hypothetical protein